MIQQLLVETYSQMMFTLAEDVLTLLGHTSYVSRQPADSGLVVTFWGTASR